MSVKRLKRLRAVEELYLQGYKPQEVFDKIGKEHRVVIGTIRNDFQDIRDIWGQDLQALFKFKGGELYLASCQQVRGLALADNNLELVHKIDQSIAKMTGVKSLIDQKHVQFTFEKVQGYTDKLMLGIMEIVDEPAKQKAIAEFVAAMADETET